MASFHVRISRDNLFREQLHLLAKRKKMSMAKLVESAIVNTYGKDLAALKDMASFIVNPVPELVQSTEIETEVQA